MMNGANGTVYRMKASPGTGPKTNAGPLRRQAQNALTSHPSCETEDLRPAFKPHSALQLMVVMKACTRGCRRENEAKITN